MRKLGWVFPLVLAACTEQATSPGDCPNFCPGGSIQVRDTIFTAIIERDSAFRGYVQGYQALAMGAADLPGVQSRPFFVLGPMITRVAPKPTDTATVPITVDSARLRLTIPLRNKQTTNLQLKLYRLPLTADSTSDFAALDPSFSGPVVDSVNLSDLLTRPAIGDTATLRLWGDSIRTDSAGHVLQIARADSALFVYFTMDTVEAPFSVPDSGRLAFGVRVAADSFASLSISANESVNNGPVIRWFYHYTIPDTLVGPDSVVYADGSRVPRFDSFVFDPPTQPLDSNLVVGGAPAARTLLRVAMPAFLHDSFDVVRATMILVPVAAFPGAPNDSLIISARPILTDLGAKSPISTTTVGRAVVHPNSTDTVRIELTDLVRSWALDTTQTTAFFLGQEPEAASWTEIRFYSSRASALRPGLHVTYVKRFPFGEP